MPLRFVLAFAFLTIAGPVLAGVQRFDDWELVCPDSGAGQDVDRAVSAPAPEPESVEGGKRGAAACRLQQAQAVKGGKDVVFLFNIVLQDGAPVAIVSTPLGVYLPAGVELKVDGGRPKVAAFEACNLTGCHAGFGLAAPLLKSLRGGRELVVTLKDTKATALPVKVSLKGLTAGLKGLTDSAVTGSARKATGSDAAARQPRPVAGPQSQPAEAEHAPD